MLTSITLHAPALDNEGRFLDAGSDVTVGDDKNMIDADRARQIVSGHGATGHRATVDLTPEPAEKAPAKAKAER